MDKSRNTVLVAENERIDAAYLRLLLERNGWEADIITDGEELLKKIKEKNYALILMNNKLKNLDGIEVTIKIREQEAKSDYHIPIVGVTSYTIAEERRQYLNAGMDYCITKPVYQKNLFDLIYSIFNEDETNVSIA